MQTRRQLLATAGVATALGLSGCGRRSGSPSTTGGSSNATASSSAGSGANDTTTSVDRGSFALASNVFDDGGQLPRTITCDGGRTSPALRIVDPPQETESYALIVEDPDAPSGTFVHWLLWNLPADQTRVPPRQPNTKTLGKLGDARQGTNSAGEIGYSAPCPPKGDQPHTYRFTLRALDSTLGVPAGSKRSKLRDGMDGHVVAKTTLTGTYGRS